MTTVPEMRWRCGDCGSSYAPADITYTCPACDGLLDGEYDFAGLAAGNRPGIDPGLHGM